VWMSSTARITTNLGDMSTAAGARAIALARRAADTPIPTRAEAEELRRPTILLRRRAPCRRYPAALARANYRVVLMRRALGQRATRGARTATYSIRGVRSPAPVSSSNMDVICRCDLTGAMPLMGAAAVPVQFATRLYA